jgi:hypothetical protein
MSKALQPVAGVGRATFELDRFELVGDDHYELEGRWSGVRGRRFIRPTLTVLADDQAIRMLADLAHKPWAAEDGQRWVAAFPCRFEARDVLEAELSVAPDITIALAPPGRGVGRRAKRPARRAAPPREAPPLESVSGHDDATALRQAQAEAKEAHRELRRQLERAEAERTRAASRMDELLGNLSQAIRERDAAQSGQRELAAQLEELARERSGIAADLGVAQQQRSELAAARDAALRARDEAVRAGESAGIVRDDALAQRGSAVTAQAQAESARADAVAAGTQAQTERDAALAVRDHALADRDAALVSLEQVAAERDGALTARDDALRELSGARATVEQFQVRRAHEASSLGAAMVMRRAVQTPPAFRRSSPILPRAVVIIVLLAIVVALMIVLKVG